MSREQLTRRCRRLLDRLSQPSSAAGLAALLALLIPKLAVHAPATVDLAAHGDRDRHRHPGGGAAEGRGDDRW